MNESNRKIALSLARRAIDFYFSLGRPLEMTEAEFSNLPFDFRERRACFVTLTKAGNLRGCMGHLSPIQTLGQDIAENATKAGFNDPRFSPLMPEEFPEIKIEISILTESHPIQFASPGELMARLKSGRDGVTIHRGEYGATYLPQVWQEIPEKDKFLSSLCEKAGLAADDWKTPGLQAEIYQVEAFVEE